MFRQFSFIFVLCGGLAACTTQRFDWNPNDYTVASGDTLHSIAWRYEIDPDDLARWNRLSPPHRIFPGERLHTRESDSLKAAQRSAEQQAQRQTRPTEITVKRGDTLFALSQQHDVSVARLAAINGLRQPYVINPGQVLSLTGRPVAGTAQASVPTTTTSAPPRQQTAPPAAAQAAPQASTPPPPAINTAESVVDTNRAVRWQWPVEGKLLARFNQHETKGIDIAGSEGRAVKAASSGKVVYSGNGLVSYGNLIIIKHSRDYLSAYALNKKLLVQEGDMVNAGQKIAELGKIGVENPRLHFEIRKNGKPVDPLGYLPPS